MNDLEMQEYGSRCVICDKVSYGEIVDVTVVVDGKEIAAKCCDDCFNDCTIV